MKKSLLMLLLSAATLSSIEAQTIQQMKAGGPWPVRAAFKTDTVGMNGSKYNPADLLRQAYDATDKDLRNVSADKDGRIAGNGSLFLCPHGRTFRKRRYRGIRTGANVSLVGRQADRDSR